MLGELKPGAWWYYFLVAFAAKATLPMLILLLLAVLQTLSGFSQWWGEIVLLSGIAFYFVAISAGADELGIRYLLQVFPLIYIWSSRIVTAYSRKTAGALVLIILLGWQMWAAVSSFPDYIPYFNELAGGPKAGSDILDDSNVDWGESLKETAMYVQQKGLGNVVLCPFAELENPRYYGLAFSIRGPKELVFNTPSPGTYIISAHNLAWMKAVDPLWRRHQPVDRIGGMLVFKF